MSDKKEYSSEEVARLMLERAQEILSKNEDIVALVKSKNTAHEIDLGSEPNSDTAQAVDEQSSSEAPSEELSEAPSEGEKAKKKEGSEDSEMEDTPLQGDSDSDTEDKDEDEDEDKDEEKYNFKKSEACFLIF